MNSITTINMTKELLNFNQILQLFNSAISQEQAWAVLYQLLKEFKLIFDTQFNKLHKYLVDSINVNDDPYTAVNLNIIYFRQDGSIYVHIQSSSSSNDNLSLSNQIYNESYEEQEKQKLEILILKSIGFLIYDALDFGNKQDCEPVLDDSLSDLLLLITGHSKNIQPKLSEDDEGYENEDDDSISIDKALMICINNVTEAEYHYKAVCRALYAQAYELKVFLAKIEDSKNILINTGRDDSSYSFEILNTTDWARLWMQIIHELRNGIKLRKVSESERCKRHIEYELTPFEILLDQIRTRQYRLRKVSDTECTIQLKKSPRDIILDFIRSRPTLKPVSLNTLNKTPPIEPMNKHESLMQSIRNYSTPLRKVLMEKEFIINKEDTNVETLEANQNLNKKRLLKADKFVVNMSDDSDDEIIDDNDLIYIQNVAHQTTATTKNLLNSSVTSMSNSKKRIKPDESLVKSPLIQWNDNSPLIEDWRALVTEDVFSINNQPKEIRKTQRENEKITRRYTMNFSDLSRNFSFRKTQPIKKQQCTPPKPKIEPSKSNSLQLSFDELCHIRSVLTKVELDSLLFDTNLYNDVLNGKICFSCRKSSFNLFRWGHKCQICKQRVCGKCLRQAQLVNGTVAQLPLSKLFPWSSNTNRYIYDDRKSTHSDANSITRSNSTNSSTSSLNDNLSEISLNEFSNKKRNEHDFELSCQLGSTNKSIECLNICVDCYDMVNGDALFSSHLKKQQQQIPISEKHVPLERQLTLELKPIY